MNEALISRWNSVVGKNDLVYNLGDFVLGGSARVEEILKRLNGKIVLILGNHDKEQPKWYVDRGFEWAYRYPIVFNDYMILSHEPQFMEKNSCRVNVHGHTHQNSYEDKEHYVNVSVECTDYYPISLESVLDGLKQYAFPSKAKELRPKSFTPGTE
jgi:calcineurin-like phosphoesterase family protein